MADNTAEEQESAPSPPSYYSLFLRIMSKRRTWVCIFVLVYAILLTSSWNFLKSILSWYKLQGPPSPSSSSSFSSSSSSSGWPALYASVLLGAVFGLLSMFAALAVMVPATLVTWIAIVVLLAFFGKPRTTLVVEGRKITREIVVIVLKILLKEGNLVAAACAILAYFALFRRINNTPTPDLIHWLIQFHFKVFASVTFYLFSFYFLIWLLFHLLSVIYQCPFVNPFCIKGVISGIWVTTSIVQGRSSISALHSNVHIAQYLSSLLFHRNGASII